MDRVPLRVLAAAAALLLLVPAAGCGGGRSPLAVACSELKASFNSEGGPALVESGLGRLRSELSVEAGLTVCEGDGLSRAVEAAAEGGEGLILIAGRGSQALDSAAAGTAAHLAGLGINLTDPAGNRLTSAEGVTCVRYKVEEGAYLSGVLAAGMTVTRQHPWLNPEAVVCFIGCAEDPWEEAYLKGFEAGVAAVNPKCAVAGYEVPSRSDVENTRAIVEAALKLKADVFFCVPGAFSREVLGLGGARGFLVITSDADGTAATPDSLLASTVLRDDLAVFRATREFLRGGLPPGLVEWGTNEGVVDFSVSMKQYPWVPAAVDQSLKQPLPKDIYSM